MIVVEKASVDHTFLVRRLPVSYQVLAPLPTIERNYVFLRLDGYNSIIHAMVEIIEVKAQGESNRTYSRQGSFLLYA